MLKARQLLLLLQIQIFRPKRIWVPRLKITHGLTKDFWFIFEDFRSQCGRRNAVFFSIKSLISPFNQTHNEYQTSGIDRKAYSYIKRYISLLHSYHCIPVSFNGGGIGIDFEYIYKVKNRSAGTFQIILSLLKYYIFQIYGS